ncbi:glutathione hydrolase 1 proenzyme-like [Dermacentor albipictus]|uniref:glutathione hydrolase 1 proenzyme-like n=1 Tax=Dermacentor albipictus TaxID=60249 RepID=UPI0031FD8EF7
MAPDPSGDDSESNPPASEASTTADEQQGRVKPAGGSNMAAYLIAACCCCSCLFVVAALFTAAQGVVQAKRLTELLTPEKYEFEAWATVSDVHECSSVVRDVFSKNGNLGDAAVSALLCMGVAAPHLMGLGGGFLALYYDDKSDKVEALNALGISPADVSNVDENTVKRGAKASIVPGAVRGYKELHEKLRGTMRWEDLFAPAIKLAKEGFPIKKHFAKVLAKHATELSNTDIKKIFDGVSKEGDKLMQPDLAKLLEDISKKGAEHFYTEVGKEIVSGLGEDAVLTEDDFKKYKPTWSAPVTNEFLVYKFYTPPFPSSGVLLLPVIPSGALKLSETLKQGGRGLSKEEELILYMNIDSTRLKESLSSVLAKLPELDGEAPDKGFPELVKEIEESLLFGRTVKNSQHKIVPDYGGVHLSIIKGFEAVTIISGINEPFGSKKASVPGLIMNNYMSAFATTPHVPNGLKGGKQPRTSMVAVFAKRIDQRVLRFQAGAGGGLPGMWALAEVLNCIYDHNVSTCVRSTTRTLPTPAVASDKDPDIEATASGIFAKQPLVSWLAPNDNVHCDGTSDGGETTTLNKLNAMQTEDTCKRTKYCKGKSELEK